MMPARKIHMLDWTEGKDRTRKREDDRKKERKKEGVRVRILFLMIKNLVHSFDKSIFIEDLKQKKREREREREKERETDRERHT